MPPTYERRPWFLVRAGETAIGADGRARLIEAIQQMPRSHNYAVFVKAEGRWALVGPTAEVTIVAPDIGEAFVTIINIFPETEVIA